MKKHIAKKGAFKKHLNKKNVFRASALAVAVCIALLLFGNFSLDVQEIHIVSEKIPDSYNNFLIAHITDYHNRSSKLIDKQIFDSLNEEKPDIIVITGDIIDSSKTDTDVALAFAEKLCDIAPVYYVPGNHEAKVFKAGGSVYDDLLSDLSEIGVNILAKQKETLTNAEGDSITLYGIDDPYFNGGYDQVFQNTEVMCEKLDFDDSDFNILLAHHPETLSVYYKYGVDLVFSGHAHGGQITLFGKAVMAPDQQVFPPYTSGLYQMGETQLVLSRGIGYSLVPLRVFCRPHLVYAELKANV